MVIWVEIVRPTDRPIGFIHSANGFALEQGGPGGRKLQGVLLRASCVLIKIESEPQLNSSGSNSGLRPPEFAPHEAGTDSAVHPDTDHAVSPSTLQRCFVFQGCQAEQKETGPESDSVSVGSSKKTWNMNDT